MQSVLARLKSPNEAGKSSGGSTRADDGSKKILLINNFMDNTDGNISPDYDAIQSVSSHRSLHNGDIINVDISDDVSEYSIARTEDGTVRTEDDVFAIDMVMNSNRMYSGRTSTGGPRLRPSRTSKLSVSSSVYSDKDDVEIPGIDSDDDALASPKAVTVNTTQAWDMFEDSIKNIDSSSPEMFAKKPKPNFVSSQTFQQVMTDMYGNSEYGCSRGYTKLKEKLGGLSRASNVASRMFAGASARQQQQSTSDVTNENQSIPEQPEDTTDGPERQETSMMTKMFAKRGWKMLKRQVNETVMEQNTQTVKLNWAMLQQTVKQMSNTDRTRKDLYERYGIIPTVLQDGTTVCENRMLSERARALEREKPGTTRRRPLSYQPPRSQSVMSKQTVNRGKLPQLGKGDKPRIRAQTAKR